MNREKTTLYICPAQLAGGYAIPKTINRIEDDAFRDCSRLKSIAFLGAKPSIGEEAFYGVRADSYYLKAWAVTYRGHKGARLQAMAAS